jgi:hypothetical protein
LIVSEKAATSSPAAAKEGVSAALKKVATAAAETQMIIVANAQGCS